MWWPFHRKWRLYLQMVPLNQIVEILKIVIEFNNYGKFSLKFGVCFID
jgi:hypothetical protein